MFELAVIRRHASGEQIVDAGVIAETLLFYGNVHVVADSGILAQLLKVVGSDNLLQLIRHKLMTMSFVRSMLAVHTENANNIPLHRFISAWVAADARGKKYNDERWVHHVFETALGKSHATRKAANKLLEHISVRTDIVVPGEPRGIPGLADADLADGAYVHSAIERAIISLVPAYSLPPRWEFRIVPGDNGFYILTDLPFNALNAEYHKTVPVSHSTLTPEFLISSVLDARADIQIASDHMAELITTEATSQIIQRRP